MMRAHHQFRGPLAALLVAVLGIGCAGRRKEAEAPKTAVAADARRQFELGVGAMDAGADRYDDAVAAFRKALSLTPDLWEAQVNIGLIELRRRRLSAAAKELEASLKTYPSPRALEALGEVYLLQNRPDRAVDLYERALRKSPGDPTMRNRLAVALRHAGKLDEAQAEIRAILGRDAGNVDAYCTLAAIHMGRDALDMAELVLNRGLARHPDDPRLLTNLGLVALRRGDDQTAFVLFEKASEVDPRFLTGRLNKAAVYLGVGDHSRAREELTVVLGVEPGNAQALLGLGLAQRMAGDHGAAQKTWEALLAIDPDSPRAHFNLGLLAMDYQEDQTRALEHLERYLQVAPEGDEHRKAATDRVQLLEALAKDRK